jgi:hypothetical protein
LVVSERSAGAAFVTSGDDAVAIYYLLLLFVMYRNRWQFSGWYKGNEKLPKKASAMLVFGAVVLLLLPLGLSMVN